MFPVQRGLYDHLSTMSHFAKPGSSFMNFDPFPFTNANLTDLSTVNRSPLLQQYPSSGDDFYDNELSNKEDINMSMKKPLSKAERRAEHNAIERARRESLNTKFQSLAQALPNLMNYRRPSKSQIVEKALDWVKQSLSREGRYRYQLLQLQRENKRLLAQLMSQHHQVMNPSPKHSVSTPIISDGSSTSIHVNSNNTSPVTTVTNPNTSTSIPISFNASPVPHMYTNDYINTNGWSNDSHIIQDYSEIPSYPSQDELANQDFSSKSEDEDNLSSGNEDDIDYHSSPYNPSSTYSDHASPPLYKQLDQQQHMITSELFPIGGYPPISEAQSVLASSNYGHSKYTSRVMNEGTINSGSNNRSPSMRLIS